MCVTVTVSRAKFHSTDQRFTDRAIAECSTAKALGPIEAKMRAEREAEETLANDGLSPEDADLLPSPDLLH